MKNTKVEADKTKDDFLKMYYISAGQTSHIVTAKTWYLVTRLRFRSISVEDEERQRTIYRGDIVHIFSYERKIL